MTKVARIGREYAHSPQAELRRAETQRRHGADKKNWSASTQPTWLTKEVYQRKIQPALSKLPHAIIAAALNVSLYYAIDIRRGRRCPHPRHWEGLAKLGGIAG
jgi:hypothetical protein